MSFIKKLIFLFEKNLLGHYKCNFILGLFFGLKKTNPLAVELLLINLTQLHTEIHIDDGLTKDWRICQPETEIVGAKFVCWKNGWAELSNSINYIRKMK